jgi:peroxin-7
MTCDFNKYDEMIATGGTDKTVKLWDLRNLKTAVNVFANHKYPIKRVKFSPHIGSILASAGFDMNVNIYDINDKI